MVLDMCTAKCSVLLLIVSGIVLLSSVICNEDEDEHEEYQDSFWEGAEDDFENEDEDKWESAKEESGETVLDKSSRQDEADVEVILNAAPMLAPDIIIGHFIDSKVTVHDAVLEGLGLPPENNRNLSTVFISPTMSSNISLSDQRDMIPGPKNQPKLNSFIAYDDDALNEIPTDAQFKYIKGSGHYDEEEEDNKENIPTLKESRSQYCFKKLNGTSGKFTMNFTQDCTFLITTPKKKTRLILHCSAVKLRNCSTTRDTLTVNLKGDMRFGRNSYLYCGPAAQVRATSLRRRISIRIRQDSSIQEEMQCNFFARQQRDYTVADNSGLLPNSNCGRLGRNSKIVGGRRVHTARLFPWVAQLDISRTDGTQTACTGSLIAPEYILTAAHCLKNSESISVFLGGTDRLEFTGAELIVQAEKYILHRKWNSRTLAADIALVKLTDPVKYTEEISPICLPMGRLRRENMVGRKGVAVGWGRLDTKLQAPRQLYRVKLPFMNERRCQKVYQRYFHPKTMFCTDSTVEAAICYGDSGGSLMFRRKEKVYQLGVASFSLSKTCGESPDVFTKVGEYTSWINNRIRPDR